MVRLNIIKGRRESTRIDLVANQRPRRAGDAMIIMPAKQRRTQPSNKQRERESEREKEGLGKV